MMVSIYGVKKLPNFQNDLRKNESTDESAQAASVCGPDSLHIPGIWSVKLQTKKIFVLLHTF